MLKNQMVTEELNNTEIQQCSHSHSDWWLRIVSHVQNFINPLDSAK